MTAEERLASIETSVKHISGTINKIDSVLTKHVDKEDCKFNKLDDRYASKEVEHMAKASLMLIIAGFITLVFTLI